MDLIADAAARPSSDAGEWLVILQSGCRSWLGNCIAARRFCITKRAPVGEYAQTVTSNCSFATCKRGHAEQCDQDRFYTFHSISSKLGGDVEQAIRLR